MFREFRSNILFPQIIFSKYFLEQFHGAALSGRKFRVLKPEFFFDSLIRLFFFFSFDVGLEKQFDRKAGNVIQELKLQAFVLFFRDRDRHLCQTVRRVTDGGICYVPPSDQLVKCLDSYVS